MSLQMYDVEYVTAEVEDFVPPDCDADELAEVLEADYVPVGEFADDWLDDSPPPLRTFWDCPPLAFAGILCATLSFVGMALFAGCVVMLLLRSTGLL
jgi:hypothetical protein